MKNIIRIYVSGKITGDRFYRKKFYNAYDQLKAAGFIIVELPMHAVPRSKGWLNDMREALRLMLKCDAVAMLPDWEESKGSKIERQLALDLGIPVKPLEEWLKGAEK